MTDSVNNGLYKQFNILFEVIRIDCHLPATFWKTLWDFLQTLKAAGSTWALIQGAILSPLYA